MAFTSEVDLEAYFVDELARLGYKPSHGATASPEAKPALRSSYHETILAPVLLASLAAISERLRSIHRRRRRSDGSVRVPRDDGQSFHGMMGMDSTRRWAAIPRDRGQV